MLLNTIQNRLNLELNGWSPSLRVCLLFQPQTNPTDGDQSFSLSRALRGAPLCIFRRLSPRPLSQAENYPQIVLYSLGMLSSGMNKYLSLLISIAATPGGVLLIDEIEAGLYYNTMPMMLKSICDFADQYRKVSRSPLEVERRA